MDGQKKISFNETWALKNGREKFLEHFEKIYPDHDLEAEWNKISPPLKPKNILNKDKKK